MVTEIQNGRLTKVFASLSPGTASELNLITLGPANFTVLFQNCLENSKRCDRIHSNKFGKIMEETRPYKKPTIKDVARRADVSVTTVSHVVSQRTGYSAETVKRVRAAIEELNYTPSYAANALQQKSTKTFGVCTSDPFQTTGRNIGSFADRLWSGILEEADLNRYKVMHFPRSIRESEDASEFLNGQIDGLIMCANRNDRRPATFVRAGLPVVMVARSFDIPEGVRSVAIDEATIVHCGLEHLMSLGHRRIAYIAGPAFDVEELGFEGLSYDDVARARLESYQVWMALRCPEFEPVWKLTPSWDGVDMLQTLSQWMAEVRPTAVFACNDEMAREVLKAADMLGISVPAQLSVLGIDNEQRSSWLRPSLSSIEVPIHPLGRLAVHTLISTLRGESVSAAFDLPAPEVLQRASTGPCPK